MWRFAWKSLKQGNSSASKESHNEVLQRFNIKYQHQLADRAGISMPVCVMLVLHLESLMSMINVGYVGLVKLEFDQEDQNLFAAKFMSCLSALPLVLWHEVECSKMIAFIIIYSVNTHFAFGHSKNTAYVLSPSLFQVDVGQTHTLALKRVHRNEERE
jgi:hypothetical protein